MDTFGQEDDIPSIHLHEKMLRWLQIKKNSMKMLERLGCIEVCMSIKHNSSFIYCDFNEGTCTGKCYPEENRKEIISDVKKTWDEMNDYIKNVYKNDIEIVKKKLTNKLVIETEIIPEDMEFIEIKITFNENFKRFEIPNHHNDCFIDLYSLNFIKKQPYYVKIQSKVKSIGELIRQTNLIRANLKRGTWILLTTEKKLRRKLENQGILVYNLKPKSKKG